MSIIFERVCDNCRNKDICKYSEKMKRVETAVMDTLRQQDNPKGSTDFIASNGLGCKYYVVAGRSTVPMDDSIDPPLAKNLQRFVY